VLVLMLVRRMRAGTAVPPIETVPQASVLQQPVGPQQSAASYQPPSFSRSGPVIQAVPNIHDSFPHAIGNTAALPILVNEATNESFPLRYDMRIGRDPGTNIRLAGDTVADHHAIIKRENSQYVLVINGRHQMSTAINGAPVEQRVVLADGDVIQIGEHHLRFMLSG
ncbi:MAG: FHA domain-containing protein, partial [Anaerolineales bacterium]|nr:FHA domain-containing protein [Anaerolineales bacterium]